MRRDGSDVRPLLPDSFDNSLDVAWSPDGRSFALTTILDPAYFEVHVARADGTQIKRITITGDIPHSDPARVRAVRRDDDPGDECGCCEPAFIFSAPSFRRTASASRPTTRR